MLDKTGPTGLLSLQTASPKDRPLSGSSGTNLPPLSLKRSTSDLSKQMAHHRNSSDKTAEHSMIEYVQKVSNGSVANSNSTLHGNSNNNLNLIVTPAPAAPQTTVSSFGGLFHSKSLHRKSRDGSPNRSNSESEQGTLSKGPTTLSTKGLAKTGVTKSLITEGAGATLINPNLEDLESRDQISEMTLYLSKGVVQIGQQQQQQPASVTSSASASAASTRPPSAQVQQQIDKQVTQLNSLTSSVTTTTKQHKSLPKISSVFGKSKFGKGARAASEQPQSSSSHAQAEASSKEGKEGGVITGVPLSEITYQYNAGVSGSLSPMTQSTRNGGLSAYEISPSQAAGLQRPYTLEDFHIVRRVGKGGFASVFLVRLKTSTGRYFALKAIKKADVLKLKQEKQVMNEKNILRGIKHSFIVELYQTFQDTFHLYMVLEYIDGGDLFSYLRKIQRFGEEEAKFYVSEVLVALQYVHSMNIIYRDLKPENILLDTTGHIKLADFGFAKVVRTTTQSFCGTPDYIAPEIIANRPYKMGVDWWSLGVLIFELTSGKTPFGDDTSEKIYDNIQAGRIKWHPLIKNACKDVVRRLLENDPEKRLGSVGDGEEIRQHPYFKTLNWKKVQARQSTPPFLPACEPPEVIERERAARGAGHSDEYMEMLKNGGSGGGSWLSAADVFSETFKDF